MDCNTSRYGFFNHTAFALATAVTSLLLSLPTASLAADVSVPPGMGKNLTISALDIKEYRPSVAYNSRHDEYLVVWHTTWSIGNRDIRGARVSGNGKVLDTFTVYEHDTKDSFQPTVAYDPVNDRYLVVWVFDMWGDGSDYDLYGRFIPWDGPDAAYLEFRICPFSSNQWTPRIAYGKTAKEFLVVWNNEYQDGSTPRYISSSRITAATGAILDSTTITHVGVNLFNPDVTYNAARDEYLLVYDDSSDIFAIRLSGTGNPIGGIFPIAEWDDQEKQPAVAACSDADQYLVAWESSVYSGGIFARFVPGDVTGKADLGRTIQIDNTTSTEQHPDVACNRGGNLYAVVWEKMFTNGEFGAWGMLVQPDEKKGPAFSIADPGSAESRFWPRVAGGAVNFLASWEHERSGNPYQDIHSRLFTPYKKFPWLMFLPPMTIH